MNPPEQKCLHCGALNPAQSVMCARCRQPLRPVSHHDPTVVSRTPLPVAAPAPQAIQARRVQPKAAAPLAHKSKAAWYAALAGALALCLCVCAAAGVGGYLYFSPDIAGWWGGDGGGEEASSAAGKVLETLPVVPGQVVSDARGASLAAPAVAQPQGFQTALVVSQPGGEVGRQLTRQFGKDLALYNLAPAVVDGVGRMDLTLPARSAQSRLALLLDGSDLVILPGAAVNGKFSVPLRPGGGTGEQAANLYFVLEDDTAARNAGAGKVAAPAAQGTPAGVSCSSSWSWNDCRRDSGSTVFVTYRTKDAPASITNVDASIDALIARITDIFTKFNNGGKSYIHANISSSRTVTIKVSSSYKEPYYSPKSGNVYLTWGLVEKIANAGEYCTAAHEIMHWIQDEQYPMTVNYYSGSESWWLEMVAMYAAYTYSPDCMETTISNYGAQTVGGGLRAYQTAPFTWASGEDARYLQGIQFYLGVCSGAGCFMTDQNVVDAINAGTYPFGSTQQAAYNLLAKDTALFMQGEPPTQGNTAVRVPASYTTGGTYYEQLAYDSSATPPFVFTANSGNKFAQVSPMKATASASIAQGGEYPLFVGNGESASGTTRSGPPGMARVAPGAEFWSKLNGQKAVFHDGKTETLIGPLGKLGSTGLRLVAYATTAPAVFNVTYETADLSGDWGASHSGATLVRSECSEPVDINQSNEFLATDQFLTYLSGFGTFVMDPAKPDGTHYVWQGNLPNPTIKATGDVTVTADAVVLKYAIHFPPPTTRQVSGPALAGLAGAGSLAALGGKKRRRLLLALLVLLPLLVSGCTGFVLYGDVSGTYTFTQAAYTDPKTNPGTTFPWTLSGKGEIDAALDMAGDEKSYPPPCHTVLATNVTAKIGAANSITFNQDASGQP